MSSGYGYCYQQCCETSSEHTGSCENIDGVAPNCLEATVAGVTDCCSTVNGSYPLCCEGDDCCAWTGKLCDNVASDFETRFCWAPGSLNVSVIYRSGVYYLTATVHYYMSYRPYSIYGYNPYFTNCEMAYGETSLGASKPTIDDLDEVEITLAKTVTAECLRKYVDSFPYFDGDWDHSEEEGWIDDNVIDQCGLDGATVTVTVPTPVYCGNRCNLLVWYPCYSLAPCFDTDPAGDWLPGCNCMLQKVTYCLTVTITGIGGSWSSCYLLNGVYELHPLGGGCNPTWMWVDDCEWLENPTWYSEPLGHWMPAFTPTTNRYILFWLVPLGNGTAVPWLRIGESNCSNVCTSSEVGCLDILIMQGDPIVWPPCDPFPGATLIRTDDYFVSNCGWPSCGDRRLSDGTYVKFSDDCAGGAATVAQAEECVFFEPPILPQFSIVCDVCGAVDYPAAARCWRLEIDGTGYTFDNGTELDGLDIYLIAQMDATCTWRQWVSCYGVPGACFAVELVLSRDGGTVNFDLAVYTEGTTIGGASFSYITFSGSTSLYANCLDGVYELDANGTDGTATITARSGSNCTYDPGAYFRCIADDGGGGTAPACLGCEPVSYVITLSNVICGGMGSGTAAGSYELWKSAGEASCVYTDSFTICEHTVTMTFSNAFFYNGTWYRALEIYYLVGVTQQLLAYAYIPKESEEDCDETIELDWLSTGNFVTNKAVDNLGPWQVTEGVTGITIEPGEGMC
jgi:hypothetical protein